MKRRVDGESRRVGRGIWTVSVTGRDSSIDEVWVLMSLAVLGIAQTTLEDSDEEDEE